VATFIGTANQFHGVASDGNCVACDNTGSNWGPSKNSHLGKKFLVLVRPENIRVETEKPLEQNDNVHPRKSRNESLSTVPVTRLGVNIGSQRVSADITVANAASVVLNQNIWLAFSAQTCQGYG